MRVTINGEVRDVPQGLSVSGLVRHLSLADGPVAVELNREVVPRAEHDRVVVTENDVIEVVHFVGGG